MKRVEGECSHGWVNAGNCPHCNPAGWPAPKVDMVNAPPHYRTGKIEVLDFIEDQKFGYLDGQVIKYVARARHKGATLEDYKKARFYLDRLIAALGA